ncbi:hypothetical protein K1719_033021 [Acacia pycnantha]|nr:hypothetical protein K1719_033021 [Acacia pycnantha]
MRKCARAGGRLEDLVVGDPLQTTKIGKHLSPELKSSLVEFLRKNRDVFAWNSSQVPGIDPKFCCHKLEVYPAQSRRSQRKRNHGPRKRKALDIHVQELLGIWIYSRNSIYNLVIKCGNGKEAKWEVESLYRLQEPE